MSKCQSVKLVSAKKTLCTHAEKFLDPRNSHDAKRPTTRNTEQAILVPSQARLNHLFKNRHLTMLFYQHG